MIFNRRREHRRRIIAPPGPFVPSMYCVLVWASVSVPLCLPLASSFGLTSSKINSIRLFSTHIAPELARERIEKTTTILNEVFGKEDSGAWDDRRKAARATTLDRNENDIANASAEELRLEILKDIPDHELVYGELGIDALATILDAVGVRRGDVFLDIGSGDGLLVMGAALLYPGYWKSCRGIEIVPDLYERSLEFKDKFETIVRTTDENKKQLADLSFHMGNVYEWDQSSLESSEALSTATLAVCFATTWSNNIPGKRLDRLSRALGKDGGSSRMSPGAKVVIIDGVLDPSKDGYTYEGELRLHCPDTAPYSTARLYTRI